MIFSNGCRIVVRGILAALTLVIAGTGVNSDPSDHIVTFGPKETDRKVSLDKGDTLIAKLPCRPGTGYRWKVSKIDESYLKLEGDPILECGDDKGKLGGVEIQVFRFNAKKSGKKTIEFEYKQPFDTEAPARKTSKLEVTVR